ncbi:hypothetical protein Y032_0046g1342 [Ancylostoma ceylanicum]|uniref:tRNA:m(4)X modification enzyme TRM13 n=1 Tax=Ancylostoma ceylanicum TaxID=53326 RepID=A0A016UCT1_9BILA|nr:hypothetical protein Y032_0046g1342 [Ancylostoma ceylanicum]
MTLQNRCAYIIPRKGRSCRMLVKAGQKYCGEHANQEEENEDRIPCPNDPKHTVDRKALEQHLLRSRHYSGVCFYLWFLASKI